MDKTSPLILPGVSQGWFTDSLKIDEDVGSYTPPNPISGVEDSVALVVPGENVDSETRRLLLPTLHSEYYGYNNDTNAHNISVPHRFYCCGSNFGWLILIDDSLDMHLYNPLSDLKIQLPSLTTADLPLEHVERYGKCVVDKAVLSSEPVLGSLSQTYALILYFGNMAICKLGEEAWTILEIYVENRCREYMDAVYYKEKFYMVEEPGHLITVDVNANNDHPIVAVYNALPGKPFWGKKRYLVESKGELFQVERDVDFDDNDDDIEKILFGSKHVSDEHNEECNGDDECENNSERDEDDDSTGDGEATEEDGENNTDGGDDEADAEDDGDENHEPECPCCGSEMRRVSDLNWEWTRYYRTISLEVFKLKESEGGEQEWEKVESIGDRAFFVGRSGSFSVSTLHMPGYRPNSIYFTDNKEREVGSLEAIRHDIGMFNLEDKTVEDVYPIDSKPVRPYPFWFAPSHGRD